MKTIINTFKYGDNKTKLTVICTILFTFITLGLFFVFFATQQLLYFFGGIIALFLTVYNMQKLDDGTLISNESNPDYHKSKGEKTIRERVNEKINKEIKSRVKEEIEEKKKETVGIEEIEETKEKVTKEKIIKDKKIKEKKKKEKKKKKINSDIEEKGDIIQEENKQRNITDEDVKDYTPKTIKRIVRKYKVKRIHYEVIVDRCVKYNINQCPAYLWQERNKLLLLLIEKEPRILEIQKGSLNAITYQKEVEVNLQEDYKIFNKPSFLTHIFSKYLPDYLGSNKEGNDIKYKNLYGIGPGIYFTNLSAVALFELLNLPFNVDDKIINSNKVNHYFKEIYKYSILLKDSVYSASKYADEVSRILGNMVNSSMSYSEFKETLQLLVRNKLITEEFSRYYLELKNNAQ